MGADAVADVVGVSDDSVFMIFALVYKNGGLGV